MKPCGVCMPFYPQLRGIVIGNDFTFIYHEPDCHTLKNADRYRLTKFQSWDEAAAKGMRPCGVCMPTFFELKEEEVIGGICTYHRPYCPRLIYICPAHLDRYQSWKKAEDQYKRPCNLCRPSLILKKEPTPPIAVPPKEPTPPIADSNRTVDVNQLTEWRRRVVRLVGKLDRGHEHPTGESIARQISRLTSDNVIPRYVAPLMRTVTEMRNIAEYESKTLSPIESDAVRAAWKAIKEWAQGQQIEP